MSFLIDSLAQNATLNLIVLSSATPSSMGNLSAHSVQQLPEQRVMYRLQFI